MPDGQVLTGDANMLHVISLLLLVCESVGLASRSWLVEWLLTQFLATVACFFVLLLTRNSEMLRFFPR